MLDKPTLGGAAVITGSWRGVGFSLRLPEPWVPQVIGLLPPGWSPTPMSDADLATWSLIAAAGGWRASRRDGWDMTAPAAEPALLRILGDLELHVAEHAPGLIAVHAGVVAWGGHAVVLPGRSMAGKSTLVHHLVRAGAQYCSDEYALLTPQGAVLPYPRALSLRPVEGGVPERLPPEQLGEIPVTPLPVGAVASLSYRPVGGWEVRPVTAAAGALAMLENAVAARTRPVEAMDHVSVAAEGTAALQGFRGEAEEAAARLLELFRW